jgi:hypothetical protein
MNERFFLAWGNYYSHEKTKNIMALRDLYFLNTWFFSIKIFHRSIEQAILYRILTKKKRCHSEP